MNAAIITARVGSPEHPDKNMYPVNGVPLITFPIQAATKSKLVDGVFISTDAADIAAYGKSCGATIIDRPEHLLAAGINHGDVIRHAVETVDKQVTALENVVVLLGNSVMIDAAVIDQGLKLLDDHPEVDSCMTVWPAGNDHPQRAMELKDGHLAPFHETTREVTTERESYQPAYYFDQGAWIFRKECVFKKDGPNPWWWMGKRCVPLVRPWLRGRDVQTYFDLALADWWVKEREKIHAIMKSESGAKPSA